MRWEVETTLSNPDYAAKALFLSPDPRSPASFLFSIEFPFERAARLRERELLPLAAVIEDGNPILLCSSLAEDVDIESVVEWFIRRRLRHGRKIGEMLSAGLERLRARRD